MSVSRTVPCQLDCALTEAPQKNSAIVWPLAIDHRLTQLVATAAYGMRPTTRKQLLAAVVLGAPADREQLRDMVLRYRTVTVRRCVVGGGRRRATLVRHAGTLVRLAPDDHVRTQVGKPAGVVWPLPIDHRLDQLLALHGDIPDREPAYRKELAAALVLACEADAGHLEALVASYRRATVHSALLDAPAVRGLIELPHFGPGRRAAPTGPVAST